MGMDFSGSAGAATPFDLLPKGQLAWAILNVKGVKNSASGGAYLDIELTLCDNQPFARRKIFDMIGDPQHAGNSEKYRDMGRIAITRILECGRGAGPHNAAGYQIDKYDQLSGLKVAIKVGIEAGTDGHDDRNRVAEWLTPNPASQSGHKGMQMLMEGKHNASATAAAPAVQSGFSGFGGGATAQAEKPATGGFGFGNTGGTAAATTGFQQPAGDAAQSAADQRHTTGSATTTNATEQSHSDPAATPAWLTQATT